MGPVSYPLRLHVGRFNSPAKRFPTPDSEVGKEKEVTSGDEAIQFAPLDDRRAAGLVQAD